MSQKKWIILFAVVIAVMAGLWAFLTRADGNRTVVITSVAMRMASGEDCSTTWPPLARDIWDE